MARCLDSVVENLKWGIELEHVVVDDGSHDSTADIVQKYVMQYPHIHFIKFDKNRGTNAARNAAIAAAKGEFCIILDSDDYFVSDAIRIVDNVVSEGGYKHYCFAADDMVDYYKSNPLIKGEGNSVLKYDDFLLERIVGDFIHVIATGTLKKYPFDEQLRIYEGVFFKRFYREAKEILFTPKIVTIRERNRSDSVTRDVLLRDGIIVQKGLKSKQLLTEWFEDDLMKHQEGKIILHKTYVSMVELNLMLSNYGEADRCNDRIVTLGVAPLQKRLDIVRKLRIGGLYFMLRKFYVFVRFDLMKSKIS